MPTKQDYRRRPFLALPQKPLDFKQVITEVRRQHRFDIDDWVLLPEHIHCIWTLLPGDRDCSKRWGLIKAGFSKQAGTLFHRSDWIAPSKVKPARAQFGNDDSGSIRSKIRTITIDKWITSIGTP